MLRTASGDGARSLALNVTCCLAFTSIAMGIATAVSGSSSRDASMVVLMVFVQGIVGAGLWLLVRRPSRVRLGEILGMALVLGPLAVASFGLVIEVSGAIPPGWSVWVALALGGVATWGICLVRPHPKLDLDDARSDYLLVGIVTLLAIFALFPYWIQVTLPGNIEGWGTLSGDAAFMEAGANSLATVGLNDYLLSAGQPLKYHFLANAWAGFSQTSIGADPYVVSTRALPLVAIVATLLLVWTWIRRMAGESGPAWWALALVVVGGPLSMQAVLFPGSSSEMWSSALCLSVLLVWWAQAVRPPALIPVATWLGAGMALAKVNSLIFFPALLSAAAALPRDSPYRRRAFWCAAVAAGGAVGIVVVFVIGYGSGLSRSLTESVRYLRLVGADAPGWAVAVAIVAGGALLALPWLGVLSIRTTEGGRRPAVLTFSLVLGLLAVASALGSAQWGKSQFYSIAIAGVALVPLSAWGLHQGWTRIRSLGNRRLLACLAAVAVISPVWMLPSADDHPYRLVLWTLVVATLVAAAVAYSNNGSRRLVCVTVFSCVAAGSAFAGAGLREISDIANRLTPAAASEWSSNSISQQHLEAIGVLKSQNSERDLVSTNLLCDEPRETPPGCLSIQFPGAAIGSQRMLLEGYSYAVGQTLPPWAAERVVAMDSFARDPSRESAEQLWNWGVRWAFVDLRRTDVRDWEPFATQTFGNDYAKVLRLRPPADY